jgi:hypothetical protein
MDKDTTKGRKRNNGKGSDVVKGKGTSKGAPGPERPSCVQFAPVGDIDTLGYCSSSIPELDAIEELTQTSVTEIDTFLVSETSVIPELTGFVQAVIEFDCLIFPQLTGVPTPRHILQVSMLTEESQSRQLATYSETDERTLLQHNTCEACLEAAASLFVALFNLHFCKIPGAGSLGTPIGRILSRRIRDNIPLVNRMIEISRRSVSNNSLTIVDDIGKLLSASMGDVTLDAILKAFGELPDLSWTETLKLTAKIIFGVAAIFAKVLVPGIGWSVIIAEFGVSLNDVIAAMFELVEACRCATPAPSTVPTHQPTVRPSRRASPSPSNEPTLGQPTNVPTARPSRTQQTSQGGFWSG